jgi:L-Ala-D/L-Glu epimerase
VPRSFGSQLGTLTLDVFCESWPLREAFTISRGSKTNANVLCVTLSDGEFQGRGEAVPYGRYDETIDSALQQIGSIPAFANRAELQSLLPAGAARNAIDCALWDLEAKRSGTPAAKRAGLQTIEPVLTAYTLSLGTPGAMAAKAASVPGLPLLKLKLGGPGDAARMAAVREARPDARLIVDANEAWSEAYLEALMFAAADAGIELIEQPLPVGADEALRHIEHVVPICADESVHTRASLPQLLGLYDAVNIKLDKAGGLTEALDLKREAEALGLRIMIGSMVATSLAVAPALLLAQGAEWTDLDGPLLLARDRSSAIVIRSGIMAPPERELWG